MCVFSQSGRVIFTETDDESRITAERVICFRDRQTVPTARAIADDESRITAEHVICFRGMRTVPVATRNERLTPPQRIVTQIILDIFRCPHGLVGSKFYCSAPYFYLPRDVGTRLSLSPLSSSDQTVSKAEKRLGGKGREERGGRGTEGA